MRNRIRYNEACTDPRAASASRGAEVHVDAPAVSYPVPSPSIGRLAYPVAQHTPQIAGAPAPGGRAPFLRRIRKGLDSYQLYVGPTRIGYDAPLHGFPPPRCSTWNIALNMAGSHPQALTDHHDVAA